MYKHAKDLESMALIPIKICIMQVPYIEVGDIGAKYLPST